MIVGALTFFPALSLGPILEHLQMLAGKVFLRLATYDNSESQIASDPKLLARCDCRFVPQARSRASYAKIP